MTGNVNIINTAAPTILHSQPYTDRDIRKILANYAHEAGLSRPISPHKLRHFLFTWLKKQGIDDALCAAPLKLDR